METRAIKTGIFREKEDLSEFIFKYIPKIPENSVLIITSKIVALSLGRTAQKREEESLIKKESDFAVRTKHTWLTLKDGMLLPSAGIDRSNANGKIVLLPKDSFRTAGDVRKILLKKYKLKNLGVVITDSRFAPMRTGALGIALGYAGFAGVRNYIGKKDIFGRILRVSKTNVADSLATAAVLVMGEGSERQPLALITGAPVKFKGRVNKKEISFPPEKDMFGPLFNYKILKSQRGQKKK